MRVRMCAYLSRSFRTYTSVGDAAANCSKHMCDVERSERRIPIFSSCITRDTRFRGYDLSSTESAVGRRRKESLANSEGPRASIKRPDSRKFVFAPLPLPSSSFRAAARSVIRSLPLSSWLRRIPACLALRLNVHRLCTRTDFVEGKNRKAM